MNNRNYSEWLTPLRFALMLGLFIIVSFPQVIFGAQTFVFRDFGYFGYPLANYFRESFWRGEIPLWNPLNDCGIPFLAQWNTQVLYPPTLLYLLLPLSWSLGIFCLAHLWLGGMGMYFLAQRWTGNRFAAGVAGVVFAFNGLMFNSLVWPATIPGLGWMPWVVWLIERAWRDGGKNLIVAAIVGALQMLSGAAEPVMFTWGLLVMLALGEIFFGEPSGGKVILRFAIIALFVAGLCAAQLLPFFELLKNSNRQENFNAAQWAMPVTGLGNFIAPFFHCYRSYHGVFMQPEQNWTTSYYVGIVTIALAVVALWRPRNWRVWLLGAVLPLGLLMAVGDATPVYKWATRAIGVFSVMRFPVKFVALAVFILPLLAAFALAQKEETEATHRVPFGKTFWFISLGVFVVLGEILWLAWKTPHPTDDWPVMWRNGVARAIFFTATLGALAAAEKISALNLRRLFQLCILVLVWLDLLTHASLFPTVTRGVYDARMPRALPTPVPGTSRAMITKAARNELAFSTLKDVGNDYLSRRYTLFSDCNLLEGIPKVDGFFPMYPREHMDIFRSLFMSTDAPGTGLLDFLGVSMITSPTNIFEWDVRQNFLPLLTGGQKPVFAAAKKILHELAGTNFNPRAEVYLPLEARGEISVTNPSRVTIQMKRFFAHRIEAEAEASAPALIVIAQTFYPAWRAEVDGKPAKLWRANHAFQAIEVSAGRHQVKLVYSDRKFYYGVVISLATFAACLVFWFYRRRAADKR